MSIISVFNREKQVSFVWICFIKCILHVFFRNIIYQAFIFSNRYFMSRIIHFTLS